MSEPLQFERPESPTDYDEVPYPGKFYPQSSPHRLATMSLLFNLAAAPVDHCRILELGCGDGGNLIPQAFYLPGSQFVGIDLSSTAIARGHQTIQELGLTNIQICTQDLLDFPENAGAFDYILVHGIYSWVPAEARQQLLKICSRHLSSNGVAYISYNALPGGHLRRYPRELMLFHTRAMNDPGVRIREARNILEFILSARPDRTIEKELLRRELVSSRIADSFMYHDVLSEVNDPIYFLDFLDKAAAQGLQFLAESDPHNMSTAHFSDQVRAQLDSLPDRRIREQYLDFIYCRSFRQTLLCRTGHNLAATLNPDTLDDLWIAGALTPESTPQLNDTEVLVFRTARATTVKVTEAIPKAIYLALNEVYPRGLCYEELLDNALKMAGMDRESLPEEVEGKIVRMIMSSFINGVVELRSYEPRFSASISEKPTASALARKQAGADGAVVSCLLASNPLQDPFARRLLSLLDGTRDREQLRRDMGAEASDEQIATGLELLRRSAMLIA